MNTDDEEARLEQYNQRYQDLAQQAADINHIETEPQIRKPGWIPEVGDRDRASANYYGYGGVPEQKDVPDINHAEPPYDNGGRLWAIPQPFVCGVSEIPANTSYPVTQWETGAIRDSQDGKARYDLIDPGFLLRLAEVMREGAEHYAEFNWVKGIPSQRYMASLLRHIEKYRAGDRSEDHPAKAAFNLMGLMRNEGTDLDDLFQW